MNRKVFRFITLIAVMVMVLAMVIPAGANPGDGNGNKNKYQEEFRDGIYIVQMLDEPVIAYEGDLTGLKATKPENGKKINPNDKKVINYVNHLVSKHEDALNRAGGGEKFYDYTYAFNGFAAQLTSVQAAKLASFPDVKSIELDQISHLDTSNTPTFLGLNAEGGLWDLGYTGEDVVVGIVDSGIWPEHPSFSDQLDLSDAPGNSGKHNLAYDAPPSDWYGDCQSGEQWSQDDCNNKIIGARYFLEGYGHQGIIQNDYKSPRDGDGHGSHTASTAAGNADVPTTGAASVFNSISGMAPRARIAVYKVCWNGADGGCFNSDSVAAIDQAVADGVDVINFSISGTTTNFLDAVEVSFLFAADAGVFVAASAGNSGPDVSTVAHPSPWLTTVAASTHRFSDGTVTLGDETVYGGVTSSVTGVGPASLVYAGDVGDPLCAVGALDPALVTGKIVACDRGIYARVDKSLAVQQAGGVGMILMNVNATSSLNADMHFVPSVHVPFDHRAAILAYIENEGENATATLSAAFAGSTPVPSIAEFSSRGPSLASYDQIKPDISAPGVDVLAAVAPPSNAGREFDLYSGTSMSSPHIAGLGALMKDAHPDWTPAMIKSAMMTTAYDLESGADPFAQGAGHVQPNAMVDPGLVYDNGWSDWLDFISGGIDPSDLNLASIAIGDLAGSQTITRTVTNVGDSNETYSFDYTLPGVTVVADPSSFTLGIGDSQLYTLTFTATEAVTLNEFTTGFIYWNGDQGHVVRSPLAVKPVALAIPGEVYGDGSDLSYDVGFGYTGDFGADARGLIPAYVTEDTVDQDPDQTFVASDPTGTVAIPVVIPEGTTYARFALFDADVTEGTDLDLFIYYGSSLVGYSATGSSNEEVNFQWDTPRTTDLALTVYVHGWGVAGGTSPFELNFWPLGTADVGNMIVTAPAFASLGDSGSIGLNFSGLNPATKYLGTISYSGADGMPAPTIVRIDAP